MVEDTVNNTVEMADPEPQKPAKQPKAKAAPQVQTEPAAETVVQPKVKRKRIPDPVPEPPPQADAKVEPRVEWADMDETEEPAPEPKVTPEPKADAGEPKEPTPKAPEFSAELLNYGEQLGFSAEEVKEFATPEAALKHLQRVHRNYERIAPKEEPKVEAKKDLEAEFDPSVFEKEEFGAEAKGLARYAKQTRDENATLKTEVGELKKYVEQLAQSEVRRQKEHVTRQIDNAINNLPQYVNIFGEGGLHQQKKDSETFKAHKELRDQMNILYHGYERSGIPIPPTDDLVLMAARMKWGDGKAQEQIHEPPKPRKDVTDRERDDRGQFIARATPRDTSIVGFPEGDEADSLL